MGRTLPDNVGGTDRQLRAVGAVVLSLGGVWLLLGDNLVLGGATLAGAANLWVNVLTRYCAVNAVLGIDTCSWDGAETN